MTRYGARREKVHCANHVVKNYTNKLHAILKPENKVDVRARKILEPRICRLTAAARGAVRYNANGSVEQLRADLMNGPLHVFGDHGKCRGSFCTRQESGEPNYVEMMREFGVLQRVQDALGPMWNHAPKLITNQTSNLCESYMSLIAKFTGGKRVDYTTGQSYEMRCVGAALSYSLGPSFHLSVWEKAYDQLMGLAARKVFTRREVRRERKVRVREQELRAAGEWVPRRRRGEGADENYGDTLARRLEARPDVDDAALKVRMAAYRERLQNQCLTSEDTERLERETRGQSTNENWSYYRYGRIGASQAGDVSSKRPTTCRGKLVKNILMGKSLDSLEHIVKGRIAEDLAREAYAARFPDREVCQCGLYIIPRLPHLCASPDFLVGEKGLAEVKYLSTVTKPIEETLRDAKERKKLRGMLKLVTIREEPPGVTWFYF